MPRSLPIYLPVRLGHRAVDALADVGRVARLAHASLSRIWQPPRLPRDYLVQAMQVGVRSLPLALAMSAFGGMVMAFQMGYGLELFGARDVIGQTTVVSLLREITPILTGLVVGGRMSAGMAAEIGGMAVTEQLDAMRALGADPLQRLVAPRLVAACATLPLLVAFADGIGFLGAMLIAWWQYDVSPHVFTRGVIEFVTASDFLSGLVKAVAFAFLIASIACSEGLRARGGAAGLGRTTIRAVVASSLTVLAADLLLTKLMLPWN